MEKRTVKREELYLLFSVDVIDSTSLKYKLLNENQEKGGWIPLFMEFYTEFPKLFKKKTNDKAKIWKYIGDEILFYIEVVDYGDVSINVKAFREAVSEWNSRKDGQLLIKGCVWCARLKNDIDVSFYSGCSKNQNMSDRLDFVGPSVDCGFRIAKYADKDMIVLSVEIVDLLCSSNSELLPHIYYKGSYALKGVFDGKIKYPIFVLKVDENFSFEDEELNTPCSKDKFSSFVSKYYSRIDSSPFKGTASKVSLFLLSWGKVDNLEIKNEREKKIVDEKEYEDKHKNDIEEMKSWFLNNFEDPAESCPYDSHEGGYFFIGDGKSHEAEDELYSEFGKKFEERAITCAARQLEMEQSVYEWNRKD